MGRVHKLGFGAGAIIENGDGTASYRKSGTISQAFRVRIGDVTGFSVTKESKALERTLKILGHGTDLASVSIGLGLPEKIEAWFRSHPEFRGNSTTPEPVGSLVESVSVADELLKLAALRDGGILTEDEFAQQKARLLG